MRNLLLLALLICTCALPSLGQRSTDLHLSATLTRGEHSRDSGSRTTIITLTQDRLTYEQTYHGMAANMRKPISKEFKLSREDKRRLVELIEERHLLVTDTIEYPTADSGIRRYFEISIQIESKGKKGAINIEGPTNAVKIRDERLYKDSTALIEELYRIINRTDKAITYEELID
jgi:hypothetical protein